jgi:uncharacterized protein (DUF427 family)
MSTRTPRLPGPDHPITIEPSSERFVVKAGDTVIADTSQALLLREANYPPIPYLPLSAIDPELLQSSDTTTYCPYKGEASYYSIRTGDGVIEDALWFYDEPYEAVGEIAGHAAFYTDKVQVSGD